MNLQISNSSKLAIKEKIQVVQMENKPKEATAIENIKIRDFENEVKTKNSANLVYYLLNLLGVNSKEGSEEHHIACFEFINTNLGEFTYQEIALAFNLYISHKLSLNDKPMFIAQQLNPVVIGNVMEAYKQHKKSSVLDEYRRRKNEMLQPKKELSEEDKLMIVLIGVQNCFQHYKETKEIEHGRLYVYDFFYENNCLPKHSKEFKKKIIKQATKEVKQEYKTSNYSFGRPLTAFLLSEGGKASIKNKCKEIILKNHFEGIIKNKTNFEEYLKRINK